MSRFSGRLLTLRAAAIIPASPRLAAALALALCLNSGCGMGGPSRLEQAALEPKDTAARAMERYDRNKDGKLGGDELSPALRAVLTTADTDHDDALSAAEIAARLQVQADTRIAMQTISGPVLWKGRPLVGATVTLVPDEIFGHLQPASGVTDEDGNVDFQIEGSQLPGVQPGFYRIEVSKRQNGQEQIPARYNAQTELGLEVGAPAGSGGQIKADRFALNLK